MEETRGVVDVDPETVEIDTMMLQIGLTEEGQLVALWSAKNISMLRKSVTPEKLANIVELTERAFVDVVQRLCGGAQ